MEQTKALNAQEPFIALAKSATSPRAAADLVTRATSAPNTFIFAELLLTPQLQSLAGSPDFAPYHSLLQIFSYGTYNDYKTRQASLPQLSDAQTFKLRQLSLLTIARDRAKLEYDNLMPLLDLGDDEGAVRRLEELVIAAVYAGLIDATLDPARRAVQVSRIAPLRDITPGTAVLDMQTALSAWSARCTTTLEALEGQMREVRVKAAARERDKRAAQDKMQSLLADSREVDKKLGGGTGGDSAGGLPRRIFNKRSMGESGGAAVNESMEVDEPVMTDENKRASKRKM